MILSRRKGSVVTDMAISWAELGERHRNVQLNLRRFARLPHLPAPHVHRRQLSTYRTTGVEADQMAQVEHPGLRRVTNDSDLP